MKLEQIIAKTWRQNILFSVMVELTYRCNLDCFFCYNDLSLKGRPLSKEQYYGFFEDLRNMQVMNLILTGGEPLAHPDFFDLGRKARELGFVIRIKSNGHALRGRLAERMKREVDPFLIDISLHGACAETHDRQTRVAGSFERLMENIPELQRLGLRLKLNCTMTRWNEHEIEGMFAVADTLGLPLAVNPVVSPRDGGSMEPLTIAPSFEARGRLFELLSERAARVEARSSTRMVSEVGLPDEDARPPAADTNCGAGVSSVTIDPYGNVLPCVQWRRPVASLHDSSIKEIWADAAELREVRDINKRAKQLVEAHGPSGRLMGFCPGLAQLQSGDPLRVYPAAQEQMEILAPPSKDRGH
jgi:MoaA/NifB/PqqE/SkfB family radical SAM enzyme